MDDRREEARRFVQRKRRFYTILVVYLALSVLWFAIDSVRADFQVSERLADLYFRHSRTAPAGSTGTTQRALRRKRPAVILACPGPRRRRGGCR